MGQGPGRLPFRRRLIFNLLMVLGTWIVIEAVSMAATTLFLGSPGQLANQRRKVAVEDPFLPGGRLTAPAVIHPYIGAVMQPVDDGGTLSIEGKYRVTEFGFVDTEQPIHKRSPDRVIVAILGGSVARQFGMNAAASLADELTQSPEFAGRSFQFVRLGSDGYKQPQQLMTIIYLLTLGAEFDIVINLDGVNEAALPGMDNVPFGVFSAYPRDWGKLIAGQSSPEFQRMGGYVTYLRHRQRDDARWFSSFPWNCSPLAQLVWGVRKSHSDRLISRQLQAMNQFSQTERTYCGSGPPELFSSKDEMYRHCADLWFRSSILLHQLCAARGIQYFHFLQPNQYVPGSKPIGPVEARIALREGSEMSVGVRACFPLMQARSTDLAKAGVDFTDLTRVFADHPDPIYKDDCCHVESHGDLIMARAIATRIRQAGLENTNRARP